MQVTLKQPLACNLPGMWLYLIRLLWHKYLQLKLQQCSNKLLKHKPLRVKPAWVKKMPTATKLHSIDNVKELFHP